MLPENRGLLALFLYYAATLVNDPIVLHFGVPGVLTPKQIAIALGILIAIPHLKRWGARTESLFTKSVSWLIAFYGISFVSYAVVSVFGIVDEDVSITFITTGANILWLFTTGSLLSRGLSIRDQHKLTWGLLFLGLIPLFSGLYEASLGRPIMSGGFAENGIGDFFWVRGFHTDKVDFVSALAPGLFLAYVLFINTGLRRGWYWLLYLLASAYLVFASFSTTGMLGTIGGLLALALIGTSARAKVTLVMALLVVYGILSVAANTERGQYLVFRYQVKYERQSENMEQTNSRYAMARICLDAFWTSPVWGHGTGSSRELISTNLPSHMGSGRLKSAHSVVSVLADLGLLGAIPFFLFWAHLYRGIVRAARKRMMAALDGETRMLVQLSVAMSFLVLARLLIYYHHMANSAFIIWPAIVYATLGSIQVATPAKGHMVRRLRAGMQRGNWSLVPYVD